MNCYKSKLLIIDDDVPSRLIIHYALKGLNMDIIDANSGEEALNLFRQRPKEFGLVILDIFLPDCEGWELISHLRNENAQIPIIALSATDPDELEQKSKENGCKTYLLKPVDLKKIRNSVVLYLNYYPCEENDRTMIV